MAEFAIPVIETVSYVAARNIVPFFQGGYDEQQVKEQILNSLDVLKDDVKALREKEYKTAYEYLKAWSKSPDVANSEGNMKRLEKAEGLSMEAAQNMKDPIDKIRSYTMNTCCLFSSCLHEYEGRREVCRGVF